MIDVIIPTCKTLAEVTPQIHEIHRTAGCSVNVIATCKPLSAAANRNVGLDQAKSEIQIMIDDDVIGFPAGWVAKMVQIMTQHPNCVMLTVELMTADGQRGMMMGNPPRGGTGVSVIESRKVLTACVAFRKDDLRYDEAFQGSGWEDDDICAQLRQRYPEAVWLICHDIQVVHLNEMKNQKENFDDNRAYFEQKWRTQQVPSKEPLRTGPKQWIALYKAYRGGEWFEASLNSIADHVDGILVSFSQKPWVDTVLPNNTMAVLDHWENTLPVHSWLTAHRNQNDQYQEAYQQVQQRYPDCYLLLIDTDEVWDADDLNRLKAFVLAHPHDAYHIELHTYVKRPTYRVHPPEACKPTVVLDTVHAAFLGLRAASVPNRCFVPDVRMHHFSYVREKFRDILFKFRSSAVGDGIPSRPDWFEHVWPQLPQVRNFHPSVGYETSWQEIREVSIDDLPEDARPVATRLLNTAIEGVCYG